MVREQNLLVQLQNGTKACVERSALLIAHIHHTCELNIVTWETQHNNADWDCFRTLILL